MLPDEIPWAYRGVAGLLTVALVANLWTGNLLWTAYTLSGCVAFVAFTALSLRRGWTVPPRAVAWGGSAIALHYLGGSLSGLHQALGPNGLYYVFPWWDNVVHFLGAAGAAIIAHAIAQRHTDSRGLAFWFAVFAAGTLGMLVEFYEFLGFTLYNTVDQGYYTNTVVDLYNNVLGGVAGALIAGVPSRHAVAHELAAARKPEGQTTGAEAEP